MSNGELRSRFPDELGSYPVIAYDDSEHEAEFGDRDYEYRLFVPELVSRSLAKALAEEVTHSNFKSRVGRRASETRLSETPYEQLLYGVYSRLELEHR